MKGKHKNLILLISSLFFCFLVIEAIYRIFDPFPYIGKWERNKDERGLLTQYDELLGWKGIPNARAIYITRDNRVWVQNNSTGFRDIEYRKDLEGKEAIVFLGDSFAWGFAVDFKDMFVNLLREKLPEYELFNLAYVGYGTDQSLLAFREWKGDIPLSLVVLMFYESDFDDNICDYKYDKFKPRYVLRNGKLVLTNVPVPRRKKWEENAKQATSGFVRIRVFLSNLIPHFVHDVAFRIYDTFYTNRLAKRKGGPHLSTYVKLQQNREIYNLAESLIKKLNDDVKARGGELVVVAIPQRGQLMRSNKDIPYQLAVESICKDSNIPYLDMAPYFRKAFFRTYYRKLAHWNSYGHKVAAQAIYSYLTGREKHPDPSS